MADQHNVRTDAATWKRLRVAAVTAGMPVGRFLSELLDVWDRRAEQASLTSAAGWHAPPKEIYTFCGDDEPWQDPWTEQNADGS